MIGQFTRLDKYKLCETAGCVKCDELTAIALRHLTEHIMARTFQVRLSELSRDSRGRAQVALARQVGMYLCHVTFGISMHDVGKMFARDRTTVAHACCVVEDRRDDPGFDLTLELLACALKTAAIDHGM